MFRDWGDHDELPVVYLPESEVDAPVTSWIQERKEDGDLDSPFAYALFLGKDNRGDLIPVAQLRNKYAVERWDVHPIPGEESDSEGDD